MILRLTPKIAALVGETPANGSSGRGRYGPDGGRPAHGATRRQAASGACGQRGRRTAHPIDNPTRRGARTGQTGADGTGSTGLRVAASRYVLRPQGI